MKIYGRNPVHEVLKTAKREVHMVYLARGSRGGKFTAIKALAENRGVEVRWEEKRKLDLIAGSSDHQGVVAVVNGGPKARLSLAELVFKGQMGDKLGTVAVLDCVQDPQNLGAIVRSVAAVEADGVVIAKDRAASMSAGALKASAGCEEHVEVVQATNISEALAMFKSAGYWVYGAEADGTLDYTQADYQRNLVLVFGGEENGLRPLVRKKCDEIISIPISQHVESLNVSVAAALVMFEMRRQRLAVLDND